MTTSFFNMMYSLVSLRASGLTSTTVPGQDVRPAKEVSGLCSDPGDHPMSACALASTHPDLGYVRLPILPRSWPTVHPAGVPVADRSPIGFGTKTVE